MGPSAPNRCLTCDVQSEFALFLNNQCLTKCPSNYYPAEYQCKRCDGNCMECADGGTKCTKCFKGSYLQGNTCVRQCRAGVEFQNEAAQTCDACISPCETCSVSTTKCDSCLQTIPQRLNYMFQCLTQCPANVTVVQETRCVNCSSNCKTCNGLPTVCTSCNTGFKLDVQDSVCKTQCPVGTSVETEDQCLPCDPTCRTCASTNASYCLTCQFGLSFYESQNQCLLSCPNRTVQVTQAGILKCLDCAPGCTECQNRTNYCTRCDPATHVFFKFTCVPGSCPAGYRRISDQRNVCVKEREDCKYGYEYNDFGECALVVQKCEPGYVLNAKLNRCIPVPGFYIPFLFLALAGAWTIYLYLQYRKGKISDRYQFIIQSLFGYTHIQTATYFIMFCLSIALDYMLVQALHLFCLFTMLLTNLSFTFWLHLRQRKNDTAFRHWCDEFKKEYKYLRWVMMAYSFKSVRIMYTRLIPNKPYMNVPFDTKYATLIKPLFFTTVVNFILQAGPIFLMNAYMLMFISWGYQLMVMSIDNMILAFVIFVLEIVEFAYFKKLAIDDKQLIYTTANKPKKDDGHQVFGGYYDEDGLGPAAGVNDESQLIYLNENKYRLERMGALTQEEVRAIENMYMTKEGYRKKLMIDSQGNDSYRQTDSQFPKYLDADQISLGVLKGRLSHAPNSGKSKEAMVLENIVKRLQEEKKFNYLQSEPSGTELINESQNFQNLLDSETRALIGNTDDTKLMTDQEKRKLRMETARERVESRLSFRRTQLKSHQKVVDERIAEEMSRAIFDDQGRAPDVLETQEPIAPPAQQASLRNLDSARTEKFNHQALQVSPSRNMAPITTTTERAPQPPLPYLSGGLNDPARLIQRDKRDFAIYFRDIKKGLKRQQREREGYGRRREWHSFDEQVLRDPWDNEVEKESHFGDQESYESYPPRKKKLKNPEYLARLELFRQNIKPLNRFDNVYTQQNDPDLIAKRRELNRKNVTRRTQTYERDIAIGYDPFDREGDELLQSDERDGHRGLEYDPLFAQNLLRNLIDNLSELPSSKDGESDNIGFTRKRKVTRENFELDDILGTFDIDDDGNIIIDQKKLKDNLGRPVNKHGYLVDKKGNILSQDGDILFSYKELEDDDLPQPYRFEKRRRHLLRHKDVKFGLTIEGAEARRLFDIDAVLINEDEQIEEEFNKLREMSRPSSVDSLVGGNNAQVRLNEADEEAKRAAEEEEERKRQEQLDNDKRQREMAKAYGGKPPVKKPKKKKKRSSPGGPQTLDDIRGPPTDRLYQGFLAQEAERVKKIARVAYRQQKADDGVEDPTDDVGFQEFFKQQMEEIRQNREVAKEDHLKSQAIYGGIAPVQVEQQRSGPEINTGFESEQTVGIGAERRQNVLDSSMTTNRAVVAPFWNPTHSQSPENRNPYIIGQSRVQVDEDAETVDGALRRADARSASNERSENPNPSSAFTTYNNLQFNHKSNTSVPQPTQHLASGSSLSTGGVYAQNIPQSQVPLRLTNQNQPYSFYNQSIPEQQLDQNQFTLADQSETIPAQKQPATTSGWKKFDFYLPTKNSKAQVKKGLDKSRDLNFSEVGQMQIQGANNSRIRDLERLYLQRYPGHVATTTTQAAGNGSRIGPQVQYNQYINSIDNANQQNQKIGDSFYQDAPQTTSAAGIRKKGISAMRVTNTVMSSDFNQTQSTIYGASIHNQRSVSNHNQRPMSSFTNIPGRQFGPQGVLHTVNSSDGTPDVFDGVARVLNNIQRLKGSQAAANLNTSADLNISNPNDETAFPGSSQGGWL